MESVHFRNRWKNGLESRGMRVNVTKTKFMVSGEPSRQAESGRWPCSVCKKGVEVNSILCCCCKKWCHKRCSGLTVGVVSHIGDFICPLCVDIAQEEVTEGTGPDSLVVGDEVVEKVGEFCYLGDKLESGGGANLAVRARIQAAWKKWKELGALLVRKDIPLHVRNSVYKACIRPVFLYGAETWAMTKESERQMDRAEMKMLRWMTNTSLEDRIRSDKIRSDMGMESMEEVPEGIDSSGLSILRGEMKVKTSARQ